LSTLNLGKTGHTFIIERSGLMVASSSQEQPFRLAADGKSFDRLGIHSSRDRENAIAADYLQRYFGSFTEIRGVQKIQYKLNGQWHFLRVTPFHDEYGLDWLIVVVIPENNFMAQINANTRTTSLLCFGALVLATAIGLYTSRRITRPILKLSQESEALAARFGLPSTDDSELQGRGSWVKEIGVLSYSFNRMAQQLRDSFTHLEKSHEALEQVNSALEINRAVGASGRGAHRRTFSGVGKSAKFANEVGAE
jgi:methyl-accepting chemotaxis protein